MSAAPYNYSDNIHETLRMDPLFYGQEISSLEIFKQLVQRQLVKKLG